jgi:hypothetical protein
MRASGSTLDVQELTSTLRKAWYTDPVIVMIDDVAYDITEAHSGPSGVALVVGDAHAISDADFANLADLLRAVVESSRAPKAIRDTAEELAERLGIDL